MKKNTILYVDDEADNLLAFKAVFRRFYQVELASGGGEALHILQEKDIDIIISDQRMPGMTGVELFEKTLISHPDVTRIVLTGYTDMESIVEAINKGKIYHYVTKPWNIEELKIIIDKALELQALKSQNRQLTAEKDELLLKTVQQERENLLAQFEILKHQINPHFLFNAMNILQSLIPVNTEKATEFVTHFGKVYRNLLEIRDEPTISLEQELAFVNSYIYLQKLRFDDSLDIQINIEKPVSSLHLPPFSIQLLLENAIKHNIVSESKPLIIRIISTEDELVVKNNFQPRGSTENSTKIGLQNLKARYQLTSERLPNFGVEGDEFVARLPLLK